MGQNKPSVYILHGEDEFAIAQTVRGLEANLGGEGVKEANLTRLDGRAFNLDDLISLVSPMPFMADRRIVILEGYVNRLDSPAGRPAESAQAQNTGSGELRAKFLGYLEKVPQTTALVLEEHQSLPDQSRQDRSKFTHWLLKWARDTSQQVHEKWYPRPKGNMNKWIRHRAGVYGGQISPPAANMLVQLVEDDTRLADQEIQKLLDYVDYSRPVLPEDVKLLTVDSSQASIFGMVDAIGLRSGATAIRILERLLEQVEHGYILSMVVRQFRFLLLVREILDGGGGQAEISDQLRFMQRGKRPVPGWMADKLVRQADRFTLAELEHVYQRLLCIDEDVKRGFTKVDLALEVFVSEITS